MITSALVLAAAMATTLRTTDTGAMSAQPRPDSRSRNAGSPAAGSATQSACAASSTKVSHSKYMVRWAGPARARARPGRDRADTDSGAGGREDWLMSAKCARHLSYANVMATLALFAALGGSSYAALNLPKNSVGPKQLRANAVTSTKVKPGSLLTSDFRRSQRAALRGRRGSRGAPGSAGPQGPAGPEGSARAFAQVSGDGVVFQPLAKGITTANVTNPGPGEYCFSGLAFTPANVQATINAESVAPAQQPAAFATIGPAFNNCPGAQFTVVTAASGALANDGFYVVVN